MKTFFSEHINIADREFIRGLKGGDEAITRQFFYQEIVGVLHKIRVEMLECAVPLDEMVSELYLYLSRDDWHKLDGFDSKNGCRLRSWMIPVAWRYFMKNRERLLNSENPDCAPSAFKDHADDDLRIQVAIDVNAVLAMMPNRRYAEIIRLLILEGFDASDVAVMLGIKVANVYNLKHRALTQFVELYGRR